MHGSGLILHTQPMAGMRQERSLEGASPGVVTFLPPRFNPHPRHSSLFPSPSCHQRMTLVYNAGAQAEQDQAG